MVRRSPYGQEHRRRRAALLPKAYGKRCPLCGLLMLKGQRLELDHSDPVALNMHSRGDRIVHESCNRRSGAVLRVLLSKERRARR